MDTQESQDFFLKRVTAATIRVVVLGAWIAWCAQIVLPFVVPVLWGGIIATAIYPLVRRSFPGRAGLGAAVFGVTSFVLVVGPAYLFFDSVITFIMQVGRQWTRGELQIPAPRPEVEQWPIIGKRLYALWMSAVHTPASVVEAHLPQLREAGRWLLQSLGGLTLGFLQSLFALAVAVAFLAKAEATEHALKPVAERIAPGRGEHLLELASATIRAVAKGVLGIAFIQALLAWAGMAMVGVPAPGAWALLLLITSVAQLPALLVLGPMVVYVFASSTPQTAIPFAVWCVLVGLLDNVLKPVLLGRGAGVPMLVIVIGAIGGMMSSGIIGLFVGSVVLAVGYELFGAWVRGDHEAAAAAASAKALVAASSPPGDVEAEHSSITS
jgi:predicted PurR-regulated permease PerM